VVGPSTSRDQREVRVAARPIDNRVVAVLASLVFVGFGLSSFLGSEPELGLFFSAGALVWLAVLSDRTRADQAGLEVRRLMHSRRFGWSEIAKLEMRPDQKLRSGTAYAVLSSDQEIPLFVYRLKDSAIARADQILEELDALKRSSMQE
jgi:hypothetical protein